LYEQKRHLKLLSASLNEGESEMHKRNQILAWAFCAIAGPVFLVAGRGAISATAQTGPAAKTQPVTAAPISDQELAATQEQLIQLLRTSPTLTQVVARDPSLLSDQEYVSRNNPQLAQFLVAHPEVARNPEYYLFTHLESKGGRRDQALERAIWPEMSQPQYESTNAERIMEPLSALAAFACFLGALVWVIRQIIENRRWARIFKLQSEVHGRLIEKFSSTQEIAAYMGTEAGRRFLEAAPIPVGIEPEQRMPNAVARVLWPLQIGVVLVLLGVGLLFLRHAGPDMDVPMLVLGTVVLMPGIGFILSAGITWILAGRLGLIPDNPSAANGPRDRQ
jgi:hypothetical protein